MRNGGTSEAVRDLKTLFEVGSLGGLSDAQLLDRFVARREGAVFEAIVRRHGPMVWGVCRRVLRDHHDAEDAFQATFLVLARKASSVATRDKLGHWLYGVAYLTAMKARATRARRRVRETLMPDLPDSTAAQDDHRDDLTSLLDRELSRLPEKYRIPIVLCELEGKAHKEAAEQLGWPVGTVSGRLSRARAILARRLSRPGMTLPVGTLAALLAQESASAGVPNSLVAPTVEFVCTVVAGGTLAAGVVPARVVTLMEGVSKAMLLPKIKAAVAALLVGAFLVSGGIHLANRGQAAGSALREDRIEADVEPARQPEGSSVKPVTPQPTLAMAKDQPTDPLVSYPFKLDADDVYEFPGLTIDYRDFHLKAGPVTVVPIATERGITGAMVLGDGTFRYTPEKDKVVEGRFRAAMLRFNPEEQAAIVPLEKGKRVSDRGVWEMSRHMLQVVIRHCWQSSMDGGRRQEVLIPPKGAFAAVLYSKEHGDLLISFGEGSATAFSFTERSTLYEKK